MYLVFIDKQFFGNTRSKKVAKSIKEMYPATYIVPVNEGMENMPFELSERVSDSNSIRIFNLEDADGVKHEIISTDLEQEEATQWINKMAVEELVVENVDVNELIARLPTRLKMMIGNYRAIEYEQMLSDDGIIFDLTYEGYIMYLKHIERM